jgi:hypothetical protein
MKKTISVWLAILVLFTIPFIAFAAKEVKVDVLYMNHGPLLATLKEIKTIFGQYGSKLAVSWHDVETDEGQKFMARKGIRGHIPLVVWMDDKVKFQVDGKEVIFAGFPTGSGPLSFQGKWKMEDLKKALNQVTNNKK